jgi:hypothetical protein
MRALLADVIAQVNQKKQTGQLSLTVKGGAGLFKIYFKDGEVYHMTCGNQTPSQCLESFDGSEFSECFFIPNIKVDIAQVVTPPTGHLIQFFQDRAITVELKQPMGGATAGQPAEPGTMDGFARIQEELKMALIRQIGPVGAKVLSNIVAHKWRVTTQAKEDLRNLVALLKEEIEDEENRKEFLSEAEKIISS